MLPKRKYISFKRCEDDVLDLQDSSLYRADQQGNNHIDADTLRSTKGPGKLQLATHSIAEEACEIYGMN